MTSDYINLRQSKNDGRNVWFMVQNGSIKLNHIITSEKRFRYHKVECISIGTMKVILGQTKDTNLAVIDS